MQRSKRDAGGGQVATDSLAGNLPEMREGRNFIRHVLLNIKPFS